MSKDDTPINPFAEEQRHTLLGAARLLSISRSTIERLRDSKELGPWIRLGRRWYIKGSDLKAFMDRSDVPVAAEGGV